MQNAVLLRWVNRDERDRERFQSCFDPDCGAAAWGDGIWLHTHTLSLLYSQSISRGRFMAFQNHNKVGNACPAHFKSDAFKYTFICYFI